MNYGAGESPYLSWDALSLYRQNNGLIHRYVVSILFKATLILKYASLQSGQLRKFFA